MDWVVVVVFELQTTKNASRRGHGLADVRLRDDGAELAQNQSGDGFVFIRLQTDCHVHVEYIIYPRGRQSLFTVAKVFKGHYLCTCFTQPT